MNLGNHSGAPEGEWTDPKQAAVLASAWESRGPAGQEAARCLTTPQAAGVWVRPEGLSEVWRERPFEVVLEHAWVTGKFDRVVVIRDAAGRALAATVYDFKTGLLSEGADLVREAAQHEGQLDLYCRAVAVLAGLAPEAVSAEILFTKAARRVRL